MDTLVYIVETLLRLALFVVSLQPSDAVVAVRTSAIRSGRPL